MVLADMAQKVAQRLKGFDVSTAEGIVRRRETEKAVISTIDNASVSLIEGGKAALDAAERSALTVAKENVLGRLGQAKTAEDATRIIEDVLTDPKIPDRVRSVLLNEVKDGMSPRSIDNQMTVLDPTTNKIRPELAKTLTDGGSTPEGIALFEELVRKGVTTNEDLAAVMMAMKFDPKRIAELTKIAKDHNLFSMYMEFWMSSILSGVRTLGGNLISNVFQSVAQPLKLAAGGEVKESLAMFSSYLHTFEMMFRGADTMERHAAMKPQTAAWKSFKSESPIFDASTFRSEGRPDTHAIPGKAGEIIRLPLRLMGATDEFFKQLNYSAYLNYSATKDAHALVASGKLLPEKAGEFVANRMSRGYASSGGAALNEAGEPLMFEAFRWAENSTFSRSLAAQDNWVATIGEGVQRLTNRAPGLKLILPFVKTPTNILREAIAYTPVLNLTLRDFRRDLLGRFPGDAATAALRAAEARGQLMMGAGAMTLFSVAASMGMITGTGPQNPAERQRLMETGWKPYSFRVGSEEAGFTYIEYRKLEPFATILGLAADMADAQARIQANPDDPAAKKLSEVWSSAVFSITRNITNKTYLMGIRDLTTAFTSGEAASVDRIIQNRVASHIPAILGSIPDVQEDLAVMRSTADAILSRLPGGSSMLPSRRNIFGETIPAANPMLKMSPIGVSSQNSDAAEFEITRLGYGFTMPAEIWQGIDLTVLRDSKGVTAYDLWMKNIGEVKSNGKTLRQTINDTVNTPQYQALPLPRGDGDIDNLRIKTLKSIISKYRNAAFEKMTKEVPEVREARRQKITAANPKLPPRPPSQIINAAPTSTYATLQGLTN